MRDSRSDFLKRKWHAWRQVNDEARDDMAKMEAGWGSEYTRQIVPEPSSVTIKAPSFAVVTPTGRPQTSPDSVTKPTRKSSYSPVALPSFIGTRMTL